MALNTDRVERDTVARAHRLILPSFPSSCFVGVLDPKPLLYLATAPRGRLGLLWTRKITRRLFFLLIRQLDSLSISVWLRTDACRPDGGLALYFSFRFHSVDRVRVSRRRFELRFFGPSPTASSSFFLSFFFCCCCCCCCRDLYGPLPLAIYRRLFRGLCGARVDSRKRRDSQKTQEDFPLFYFFSSQGTRENPTSRFDPFRTAKFNTVPISRALFFFIGPQFQYGGGGVLEPSPSSILWKSQIHHVGPVGIESWILAARSLSSGPCLLTAEKQNAIFYGGQFEYYDAAELSRSTFGNRDKSAR